MDTVESPARNHEMLIELTADVVAAYVSNNPVPVGELPNLIADVHSALGRVGGGAEQPPADKQKPAVNPKRSVHDEYIVCLEDGKKFKSLKRHLGEVVARRQLSDGCPELRGSPLAAGQEDGPRTQAQGGQITGSSPAESCDGAFGRRFAFRPVPGAARPLYLAADPAPASTLCAG
jgi:hypothetical protein